ncbi:MATE family efflux transporter [Paenibacillus sinopodophylli]|uniref:MATE family efflux transporter n=1 Tax=Paenibacillus sinopodophylli TaxID=1837342 RepID=UPI00110CEEC6|nr:MATE family efflux transporter [Paenibacillus sinopodophylli]
MNTIRKSEFNREMKGLVIPSVLQMLVGNSFSLVNMLMVTSLGDGAVAVTAAAGRISFILSMILTAVYGMTAYMTQYYGKQQYTLMRATFGFMLLIGIGMSLLAFVVVSTWKEPILTLFIKDAELIPLGVQYVTIMAFVFLISAIRDAYAQALGSIGKVKVTLYVGLFAMAVNIVLDYGLIYGKLGFPELGVAGAAWGTLISSGISLLFLFVFIYSKSYYFNIGARELFSFPVKLRKQVLKTISPLVFHEGMWSIGNMLYAVAFGSLGIAALTTFQLANTLQGYFMMGIHGFAYAAKVMIGQKLGQDNQELAMDYGRRFTRISVIIGIVISVVLVIVSPFVSLVFPKLSAEVHASLGNVLLLQALAMTAFFLNNVWIVGMFRAGGDNLFTMNMILITTWGIALPAVFVGAYVLHLPLEWVYGLFLCEEISKALIGYRRYRSQRWMRNLVGTIPDSPSATASL